MDIVLCDDHLIVTESLTALFQSHGHRIVATATRPDEVADLVNHHQPHVCVTDLLFDDDDPQEAFEMIRRVSPLVDVIVLSGASGHGADALAAGATAVGSKAMAATEMLSLVEGRCADGALPRPAPAVRMPYFLTEREVEVLQSLSEGDSTARMAERLGVRNATARSHVQSVLLKLGVHSRVAAVSVAVEEGMVDVSG